MNRKKNKSKDLTITEISKLPSLTKQYQGMLKNINSSLPAIKKTSSNFYKSHSQFMGVMLDVTAITPVTPGILIFPNEISFLLLNNIPLV